MPLRGLIPLSAVFFLTLPLAAQPSLVAVSSAVSAGGLTPNGRIVWFGLVRDLDDWVPRLNHFRQEATADAEGQAELELQVAGPATAVWAVVDVASGAFASARPDEAESPAAPLPAGSWQAGGEEADQVVASRSRLDLLLVRPGGGAWGASVGDGGALDLDQQSDGVLTTAVDRLSPVGPETAEAPARGATGDLLLAIDPDTFELFALRLP